MDYKKKYRDLVEAVKELQEANPSDEGIQKWVEDNVPELAESEDERIRKGLLKMFNHYVRNNIELNEYGLDKDMVLAWLEKQKEFVSVDFDDVWKTADCDELTAPLEKYSKDAIKKMCHAWYDKGIELERKSCLEKQGEQKSTDKDETKFHVNEWVVTDKNDVVQIKAVNDGYYIINNGMKFNMSYVDRYWHKWTIYDAKPGDVLASKDELSILIFRNLDTSTSFSSYYNIQRKGELGWSNECFIPATKEQRDLLFRKMREAGYEWDAEKKELKKIKKNDCEPDALIEESYRQQADDLVDMVTEKPAWSEEDETTRNALINLVEMYYSSYINKSEKNRLLSWLKSLKSLVK